MSKHLSFNPTLRKLCAFGFMCVLFLTLTPGAKAFKGGEGGGVKGGAEDCMAAFLDNSTSLDYALERCELQPEVIRCFKNLMQADRQRDERTFRAIHRECTKAKLKLIN